MAILKVFSLVSLLAAIVIGTYLYVSSINNTTPLGSGGSNAQQTGTAPANAASGAVNNFNDQSQQRLQDVQSQYSQ
jgi:uncharacterized protein (UPF0333 family)